MVHNAHKRADNLFSSDVCRLKEQISFKKEYKVVYPRAHYKIVT